MLRILLALALLAPVAFAQPGEGPTIHAIDDAQGGGPGYRFEPLRLEAAPGQEVVVVNDGRDIHTVTAAERSRFDVQAIQPGERRTFAAPQDPGEYSYRCVYHPEMTGTLVVTLSPATPSPSPVSTTAPVPQTTTPTFTATTPSTIHADPGFEAVLLVGALLVCALLLRRP